MIKLTSWILVGALCSLAPVAARAAWSVARSPHFEVYSQSGPARAELALARFEEIRAFFERNHVVQSGSAVEQRPPVRVVVFSSRKDYDAVNLRPSADAYYIGTPERDYIVMPMLAADDFSIAAHEYAHSVLYARGLKLPRWLNEGIAELFSTVRISSSGCEFGGELPARTETLRHHAWLPAAELLAVDADSPSRASRAGAEVFYAESWALVDMLTSSPGYAPHFASLMATLNSGDVDSPHALAVTYRKSADAVLSDARDWIARARSSRRTLPSVPPDLFAAQTSELTTQQSQAVIADLLFAMGQPVRAEQAYQELLSQAPSEPEILGPLGSAALRNGHRSAAIEYWHRAIDHNFADAALCYRYALLAEEMALPSAEIARALERAIAIQPDFDDARYKLALLQSNQGEYSAAVEQLQAMAKPSGKRAYGYWTVLSNALAELGRRDAAERAANEAMRAAATAEERALAAQLAYIAQTDLTVRVVHDAAGNLRMSTTRVPRGSTDFNPFIEPGDRLQVAAGKLREVKCAAGKLTGFLVQVQNDTLFLSVPDPLHVQMRNAPTEFYCGPQHAGRNVIVEYAAASKSGTGVLRGMDFR